MKFELSVEPIWKRCALAVMRGALAAAVVAASCWISSLRSSTARRCFCSSISCFSSALLSPDWAGACCASAAPEKGSSAAMASATARLLFTLVLLGS
jgi:hypothetical protein